MIIIIKRYKYMFNNLKKKKKKKKEIKKCLKI